MSGLLKQITRTISTPVRLMVILFRELDMLSPELKFSRPCESPILEPYSFTSTEFRMVSPEFLSVSILVLVEPSLQLEEKGVSHYRTTFLFQSLFWWNLLFNHLGHDIGPLLLLFQSLFWWNLLFNS